MIGLALPELSLRYFAELADAVIREAEKKHLVVFIEQTGGDREKEIEALSSPRRQLTDGLIFSPLGMSSDDASLLNVSYPLVLLGERIFGGPVDHVTMRNVEAATAVRVLEERIAAARAAGRAGAAGTVPVEPREYLAEFSVLDRESTAVRERQGT